jgi:hypothetical protein
MWSAGAESVAASVMKRRAENNLLEKPPCVRLVRMMPRHCVYLGCIMQGSLRLLQEDVLCQ